MTPNIVQPIIEIAAGFLAGLVLGALHFGSLYWNCRFFAQGVFGMAAGLQILRFAALAVALWALARFGGAVHLLGCGVGLLTSRAFAIRTVRVRHD